MHMGQVPAESLQQLEVAVIRVLAWISPPEDSGV